MIQKLKETYQRHQRWTPIVFFVAGFLFDTFMLRRVDELVTILQQAAYIGISALLIRLELRDPEAKIPPHKWLIRVWHYREDVLHFLVGTLLNAYTIFFFKSAGAVTSFFFIGFLVLLLIANEFGRFGKSQTKVHIALLSLCVISYLVTLVPIIMGFIGVTPFLLANALALTLFWAFMVWLRPIFVARPELPRTHVQLPFFSVLMVFAILYFTGAIPPVPLSVRYMGIYHDVQKSQGRYELSYSRPSLYFWEHGDQTFLARPGDTIICFARVFSPSRFKDELLVHWLFRDPKKKGRAWESRDRIPFPILGGREEGYRGITKKNNYQPGDWRVQIETHDGQEVGGLSFTVEEDLSTEPRIMTSVVE